jgi:hypothetical protein
MSDIFKGGYGQHSLAHKISTVLENKISLNEEDCSCNYHEKKCMKSIDVQKLSFIKQYVLAYNSLTTLFCAVKF